jgi:hypothetical protein
MRAENPHFRPLECKYLAKEINQPLCPSCGQTVSPCHSEVSAEESWFLTCCMNEILHFVQNDRYGSFCHSCGSRNPVWSSTYRFLVKPGMANKTGTYDAQEKNGYNLAVMADQS